MFSVIFPGQGSQSVGMCKEFYEKHNLVKQIYKNADDILKINLSKLILEGPSNELNKTENTQPAIFLVSYAIFELFQKEFGFNLNKINFFAGHSLGEYTAITCSGALKFEDTLKLLKVRGQSMQNAVPEGQGGMLAILGSNYQTIKSILEEKEKEFNCFIANDNSDMQIVVSGYNSDLNKLNIYLNSQKIKNIKLQVSAPFHCKLMQKATLVMKNEIEKVKFNNLKVPFISNVTANIVNDKNLIPNLLIKQIESPVLWRDSIKFILNNNISKFIEIGPGKVLSNLIKRIDRNIKVSAINNEEDIKNLNLND